MHLDRAPTALGLDEVQHFCPSPAAVGVRRIWIWAFLLSSCTRSQIPRWSQAVIAVLLILAESGAVRAASGEPDLASIQRVRDASVQALLADEKGQMLESQGDFKGALVRYEEAVAIHRALLANDPSQPILRSNLAVALSRLSMVLLKLERQDPVRALAAAEESLVIAREVAAKEPSTLAWQYNLSRSVAGRGDVLLAKDDRAGALDAYRAAETILRRLVAADGQNLEWRHSLALCHLSQAHGLYQEGDHAGAVEHGRECLAGLRTNVLADPHDVSWLADLAYALDCHAEHLAARHDWEAAAQAQRESLVLIERVLATEPANPRWEQRSLWIQKDAGTRFRAQGQALQDQGDLAGALKAYGESARLLEPLANRDQADAEWSRAVSSELNQLGQALSRAGQPAAASRALETSLVIVQSLLSRDSFQPVWLLDRATVCWNLDCAHRRANQLEKAREWRSKARETLADLERSGRQLPSEEVERKRKLQELVTKADADKWSGAEPDQTPDRE